MFEDEIDSPKELEEATKLREKFLGHSYHLEEITMCLFENVNTFPYSVSILAKIPVYNMEWGLVYAHNPYNRTYKERACKSRFMMNKVYSLSKQKILSRSGLSLGWEGRMLNEPEYS